MTTNQAQSPEDEFLMLYEVGDRVKVSLQNSLFIGVNNLEGVVTDINLDTHGEVMGYDVYFRAMHRTLFILECELIPLEKVAV